MTITKKISVTDATDVYKDWIVAWPPENQEIRCLYISSKLRLQCQPFKAF